VPQNTFFFGTSTFPSLSEFWVALGEEALDLFLEAE